MDIYFLLYIGAFLKWIFSGFRHKFTNELNGEGDFTHIYEKIGLDTENTIIGLIFILVILVILIISLNIK
jgi:hypothetical protein